MLTVKDFAAKHGFSESVTRMLIKRHGLPFIKIGARVFLTEEDFTAWVEAHKKVISEKPDKPQQIAMPKQCRKSSLAGKMRKIY